MKILQIVPYFYPYNGGQEQYIYNLSRHLVKMGHNVHIITSNFPITNNYEVIDGITVERYKFLIRILRNPIVPSLLQIRKKIYDFDIIHTHNEHSYAAMITSYYKNKIDFPLILTCHGQLKFGDPILDIIEKVYSKYIGKRVMKTSDLIIALSNSDKKYISSFGVDSKKIHVIPNAIDPSRLIDYNLEYTNLNLTYNTYKLAGKRIVLFVGPVIKRKGVEYLIKAIPIILENIKEKNIIFIFTGSGDYIEEAKKLAIKLNVMNEIIFTDIINFRDLLTFYQISDIFILPSLSEGVPTSILEAMFFKLPVISSDIPGIRDYFKDSALLIPPKDEKRLAKSIIILLEDEKLRKMLSNKGKELIDSKFLWEKVAKEYELIYKNLISWY